MTSTLAIEDLLGESEREVGRFAWDGTFADYLRLVVEDPSVSRLSHKLVYDAIAAQGIDESATGERVYNLFDGEIYGLDSALEKVAHYFASSSRRFEIRKRILLLLGPPASGKSSIVTLIKRALERFTRTEEGAIYAIKGCPMQEEPLHLIPAQLRPRLMEDYGIYVEGELCPRCRYNLRVKYNGKVSQVPVTRVTFSEDEAIGIGYYVASNPNPSDASLLVGSIDTAELEGDRVEVAGRAFRLDGEFNVANRGMMELVEVFKADPHILTTLLGLAQEQLIKMDRFGSIYADEVIIGHTNEGDFNDFKSDERSEALKDRLIEIRVPYNVRVRDEVGIYRKMVEASALEGVHISALTLPVMSVFAVLSRLEPPTKQGMPVLDKLRLYDGQRVLHSSPEDVEEMRRHHVNEGMSGISPRYVMNRLSVVASTPDIQCISPLLAVDSLWQGLKENVNLEDEDLLKQIELVRDTVQEYSNRAIMEVQRAFKEGFEESASDLLNEYLDLMDTHFAGGEATDREMREMEKHAGIADNRRSDFRRQIHQIFSSLKRRGISFDYNTEPRLKAGIEARLFPSRREIERTLTQPRFARQRIEWRRERTAVYNRLINTYDYCPRCADNLIEYVVHALKRRAVVRFPKNEGIEWLWDLNPEPPSQPDESS